MKRALDLVLLVAFVLLAAAAPSVLIRSALWATCAFWDLSPLPEEGRAAFGLLAALVGIITGAAAAFEAWDVARAWGRS